MYQRFVRDEKLREAFVSSFLQADNYAVTEEILVNIVQRRNSEQPLVKLRAAIVRESQHFPDE